MYLRYLDISTLNIIYTLYLQYLQVHHLADRHQHERQELRGGAGHRLRRHHQLRGTWSRTTSVNIIFLSPNIFQKLAKVQAPLFMLNGFYVKGLSTNFNIGGTDSRDDLMARYVLVKDNTGAIIGCTSNLLV